MSSLSADEHEFIDSFLQDLRMGYVEAGRPEPYQSILFVEEERKYFHPWSFESIGERFGINKLEEFMPLKDYVSYPMHIGERLVKGMVKGRTERLRIEKEAREAEAARHAGNTPAVPAGQMDIAAVMAALQAAQQKPQ